MLDGVDIVVYVFSITTVSDKAMADLVATTREKSKEAMEYVVVTHMDEAYGAAMTEDSVRE